MLPRSHRQEALSRAYVRAVAAQAGVTCGDVYQDYGIDIFLRYVTEEQGEYQDTGPQLDLLLTSTTRAEVRADVIVYDLEVRAYNLLRGTPPERPAFLVLLVLPQDQTLWVNQSAEELVLRRCAYWISLQGSPPTSNEATVRIAIPHANVFSAAAIQEMMTTLRGRPTP